MKSYCKNHQTYKSKAFKIFPRKKPPFRSSKRETITREWGRELMAVHSLEGHEGKEGRADTVRSWFTMEKAKNQKVGCKGGCGHISWSKLICLKE